MKFISFIFFPDYYKMNRRCHAIYIGLCVRPSQLAAAGIGIWSY